MGKTYCPAFNTLIILALADVFWSKISEPDPCNYDKVIVANAKYY